MLHKKLPQHIVSDHTVSPKILFEQYEHRWLEALDKHYLSLIYQDQVLTEVDRSVCLYIYKNKSLVTLTDLLDDLEMPYDILKKHLKQLEDLGYLLILHPYIVADLPNAVHPFLKSEEV